MLNSVGYGVNVKCKVQKTYDEAIITYFMVKCYNLSEGLRKLMNRPAF
jgi:hypothetical protein